MLFVLLLAFTDDFTDLDGFDACLEEPVFFFFIVLEDVLGLNEVFGFEEECGIEDFGRVPQLFLIEVTRVLNYSKMNTFNILT